MPSSIRGFLCISVLSHIFASASPVFANDELYLPALTFPSVNQSRQQGDLGEALAILERLSQVESTEETPAAIPLEALVLRASLLHENGRAKEAESDWREIIKRKTWMRTFARRALVKSLVARSELDAAESILADLNRSDPTRHHDLSLTVANAQRNAGKRQTALHLYQELLERQGRGRSSDQARLAIANILDDEGKVDAAMAQLREAKEMHWQANTFDLATTMEQRLLKIHGVQPSPFAQSAYRTLVPRLRNASRFETALSLIAEWREVHALSNNSDEISTQEITTLYAQRSNQKAIRACADFYLDFPESDHIPSVKLTDFRLAVRVLDVERAHQLGLDLWEKRVRGATNQQRRDAATLLAAFLVAIGDVSSGLDVYRQLFSSAQSADEQRALLWRAGVAALKDGHVERALNNLRGLNRRKPTGDLAPAGLYWLGVAESKINASSAIRTLETVVELYPYLGQLFPELLFLALFVPNSPFFKISSKKSFRE